MHFSFSIRATLALLFGVLAMIPAIQGILSLGELTSIRDSTTAVASHWIPSVEKVNTIEVAASEVRIKQYRLILLSNTPEKRATNDDNLAGTHDRMRQARQAYEPMITTPEERSLYEAFAETWTKFERADAEVRRLLASGQQAESLALLSSPAVVALYDDSRATLARLVSLDETTAARAADAAVARTNTASTTACVGIALAIAAALVAAVIGLYRISRPIVAMTGAMSRLAEGDANTEVPFRQRGDEIGAMAAAVQVFKDNLIRRHQLESEAEASRRSAEAQRRAGMHQVADRFAQAIGTIVGRVSSSATELQSTAEVMTETATRTAGKTTTVATAAELAANNVNTVAAAAEELGSSVQEIGRQVDGSAKLAQLAVDEADHTGALVQELSAAVAKIGDVAGLIASIAGQTNLLALNATIEAARAGDAGRGFAVVAAEVKALAEQTARATEEISGQIARVQGSTGQAVTAIGAITARIQEINAVAASIAAAVEEQGAATQEIVRNIGQAAQGTAEVTNNIVSVATATEETNESASQVLAEAARLSEQSEHLTAEVDRFLETIRAA
jgi:methyl-accepting chemotaxis protein